MVDGFNIRHKKLCGDDGYLPHRLQPHWYCIYIFKYSRGPWPHYLQLEFLTEEFFQVSTRYHCFWALSITDHYWLADLEFFKSSQHNLLAMLYQIFERYIPLNLNYIFVFSSMQFRHWLWLMKWVSFHRTITTKWTILHQWITTRWVSWRLIETHFLAWLPS